jgi:alanyl-tRNA synthetase
VPPTSQEVRQQFIDFFLARGHTFVRSAPVVPQDDPTLLFTNAGMNQFKDVFLGTGSRPYQRAVNSQKCIRVSGKHNDLEEVGLDTYHHTFFEMLGNWSFGDYYKREAILWAWELLTEVWKLPKRRLYATVYQDDQEAERLWRELTDVPRAHVLRFGKQDNFWEMGETGPCGPCSEIHIDRGPQFCDRAEDRQHRCAVNGGCARIIELWNLVFIQFNCEVGGSLVELPAKHVDTGLGLERLVAVLQDVPGNYDTDLFRPILVRLQELTGKEYRDELAVAMRVVADHLRMLCFSIADGALPSNEGRGYVLRRLLRRATRYGRNLGMHQPFIHRAVDSVIQVLGAAYPELGERRRHIERVILAEEESFNRTLDRGLELFADIATRPEVQETGVIPGADAFRLYDTFGFPFDLTQVMAREQGLRVDTEGFEAAMAGQRERGRKAGKFSAAAASDDWKVLSEGASSRFVGYEELAHPARLRRYLKRNGELRFVADITPFYAESGGQVGDAGELKAGGGLVLPIRDTQKAGSEIVHIAELPDPELEPERELAAGLLQVDGQRREHTARHHTATHLLHAALRQVLGEHVHQSGSLVHPDHLRFDFTHFHQVSEDQLKAIEELVNQQVVRDEPIETFEKPFDQARTMGAMALFGEKYGEIVRCVRIGDFSLELCGGTHLPSTGAVGYFKLTGEGAVAAGVRRVEALAGPKAVLYSHQESRRLRELASVLMTPPQELGSRLQGILEEKRALEKELEKLRRSEAEGEVDSLLASARELEGGGVRVVAGEITAGDEEALKAAADKVRQRLRSGIGVLAASYGGKHTLVCVVTDDLIARGIKAGDLVREVARIAGGKGGGRPHLAMAGLPGAEKLPAALAAVRELVEKRLSG